MNWRNVNSCQKESTKSSLSSLLTQPLQRNGTLYHSISHWRPWLDSSTEHGFTRLPSTIRYCLRIASWSLSGASVFSSFYLSRSHTVTFSDSQYFFLTPTVFSYYHFLISKGSVVSRSPQFCIHLTALTRSLNPSIAIFSEILRHSNTLIASSLL